jgi:integrase
MGQITEKIDPHRSREKYTNWKIKANEKGIDNLSRYNSTVLLSFLTDMGSGLNVSNLSKKGPRSYLRLNSYIYKLSLIFRNAESKYNLEKITEITERQLHELFLQFRNGEIRRIDGGIYKSTADYVKSFKTFWHWWMKVNKKSGVILEDITVDLDTSNEKPVFVYFTEDELRKLCNRAKYEYKVLMWFLFDSGIRAPTELLNVKIMDFSTGFKELTIREEISKTFGRRIKLLLCPAVIREYVEEKNLQKEDFLFKLRPAKTNQYLKNLAKKVLGKEGLTMYDFRHASACYWLPRYKSESAMKYRFGWKKSDMIHYYTEFLGMKDTITEEDLLIDITKTEIEKQLQEEQKRSQLLEEKYLILNKRIEALEIGLMEKSVKEGSPIFINTPLGQVASSVSGTMWQDDRFKSREEYENGI